MSRHHIRLIADLFGVLAVFALIVTGCREESQRQPSPVPPTEITAPLDSIFGAMFPQDEPGALVMVMRGDSIVYDQGFGTANLLTGELVSDSTLFNIADGSKQFTALAILKLHEQGKLNLDDNLHKFFPEWDAPFYRNITLRHILSHTSGLPDVRPRTETEWREYLAHNRARFSRLNDYLRYSLVRESLQMFDNLDTLSFTPGSKWEFQNPTYQLMALVIDKLNPDASFEAWMRQNIFNPAGMDSSQFYRPIDFLSHEAHGYRAITSDKESEKAFNTPAGRWEEFDYGEAYFFPTRADKGLYTSGREYMRWQRALNSGAILTDSLKRMAETPVIETDSAGIYYGLGYFIDQRPDKPHKLFHSGKNGGFSFYHATLPDDDITYIIMATRGGWDRNTTSAKVDSVLEAKGWVNLR